MPTYLALVDVESPEPLLVKVHAASFNDAEFRVMHALDVTSKSRLLGVWDVAQVQDVGKLLPRRRPDEAREKVILLPRTMGDMLRAKEQHVRSHVRRR